MKNSVQAIVLAAGKSTRFNTEKTKLAERICGQPMIVFSTRLLQSLDIETTVVVGYEKETIQKIINSYHTQGVNFVTQEEQLGTGHALSCTQHLWNKENILIINGDMPLVTESTIIDLYKKHQENNATVSFVSSCTKDINLTKGYGRVVTKNNIIEIVEAKDFTEDPSQYCCINAGIYLIKKEFLSNYIKTLHNNNASKELYITDLIKIASENNKTVTKISAPFDIIRGVNTLEELHTAEHIKRLELINYWMKNGVRFLFTNTVHIDTTVTIGQGSIIGSGVQLLGKTSIGKNALIDHYSHLENTHLDDNVHIQPFSILKDSIIGQHSSVGPFAFLRNNTILKEDVVIGNFIEIKNSTIGTNTKAKHLSYIGDATIGAHVNIGAGTITCNYDGINKHKTTIQDHAFIGSNNTLIAPITIEENAFTAAGSTLTENVPSNALAIGRSRQVNKLNYVEKLYLKHHNQKKSVLTKEEKTDHAPSNFSFVAARLVNHDIPTEEQ